MQSMLHRWSYWAFYLIILLFCAMSFRPGSILSGNSIHAKPLCIEKDAKGDAKRHWLSIPFCMDQKAGLFN